MCLGMCVFCECDTSQPLGSIRTSADAYKHVCQPTVGCYPKPTVGFGYLPNSSVSIRADRRFVPAAGTDTCKPLASMPRSGIRDDPSKPPVRMLNCRGYAYRYAAQYDRGPAYG